MTAEDEVVRRGGWERIFPCANMGKLYLPFFEFPRYSNIVLAKWMERQDWALLLPFVNRAVVNAVGSSRAPKGAVSRVGDEHKHELVTLIYPHDPN